MKRMRKIFTILTVICLAAVLAYAQTTEFTYQGSLKDGANLANGNYDFEFALFDGGGAQLGGTLTRNAVAVANGIFSVSLDFGNQFSGAGRLLEIRVRLSGGGGFTTLTPRQPVNSAPYSVKSLNADNATNATNATNAVNATTAANFTGALAGDVTGTQSATTVARLQGRNVANTAPTGGQVLKFNSGTNQWTPDTDLTGSGGTGTIMGVTAGTGLNGGGTSGTVTVGIAPGGVSTTELAATAVTTAKLADGNVTTAKLADGNVTDAKIVTVSGSKITGPITTATIPGANVTGPVANATNATTAVNFTGPLAGDVTGTQNATLLANNAVTTAKIADSAVTSAKIAAGQVVKSVNGLMDNVTLAGSANITITPAGNTLTIASTSGGVGGSGTASPTTIPLWTGSTTLGNSLITQSGGAVQLPTFVSLAPTGNGIGVGFGNPNGETGLTINGGAGTARADIRYDGSTLKLVARPPGSGPPPQTNGIAIANDGTVKIGTDPINDFPYLTKLQVNGVGRVVGIVGVSDTEAGVLGLSSGGIGVIGSSTSNSGVVGQTAVSSLTAGGVYGRGIGSGSIGVIGESNIANAVGVFGVSTSPGGVGVYARNLSGGRAIVAEGDVVQPLSSNGLVKAMLLVNADGTINLCYNSQLSGSAATTPPCGFSVSRAGQGDYRVTFPFQVNVRFFSATIGDVSTAGGAQVAPINATQVRVTTASGTSDNRFYLLVY